MNPVIDQLRSLGYSDCFRQEGKLWGFLNNSVMPIPIPEEIITSAIQQDKCDRLAEWPNFSWRQRLRFWCDRTWHNLLNKRDRRGSFEPFEVAQVLVPAKRTLLIGNPILCHSRSDGIRYGGSDLLYYLASQWRYRIQDREEVIHNYRLRLSFVVDPESEFYNQELVIRCDDSLGFRCLSKQSLEAIEIWIISNCDRETADIAAAETGFPAHFFYALPSHLCWVYFKESKKLILGGLKDKESWLYIISRSFSRSTKLMFTFILFSFLMPKNPVTSFLSLIAATLLIICLLRDQNNYLRL